MTDSPRRGSVLAAYALLLLAAASWGGNWVAARSAIGEVPPITLVFWRWTLASALLVAISIPHLRRDAATLRASWRAVVGLGVIGTTEEIAADDQALAVGALKPLGSDGMLTVASPFTVEGSPQVPPRRAPEIGEHSSEVLRDAGYSAAEIAALKHSGAVAGT